MYICQTDTTNLLPWFLNRQSMLAQKSRHFGTTIIC
jgi:hypothetical protein